MSCMTRQETVMHNKMKKLLESSTDGSVTFKNYKVLCTELKLQYYTGNSKKAQLRKLSYFCNLEKGKGNSLFYTEVYPDPDQRMLQEKLLTKNIEMILLKTFLNSDGNTILLNNHDLWELLGFINSRYSSTREEKAFIELRKYYCLLTFPHTYPPMPERSIIRIGETPSNHMAMAEIIGIQIL